MTKRDIPTVARLFSKAFRDRKGEVAPDLEGYLETVFFGSPHYRPEHGSIVYEGGSGDVASAILAVPMEFTVHGRPIIAKLLCAFMADGKDGAAGAARLARQMRATRQDLCFSDNSSPVSADHWVAGGGAVLPIQSLEWQRSFRPLAAGAIACGRYLPLSHSRGVLGLLGWFDGLLRRQRPSLVPVAAAGCRTNRASPEEFFRCAGAMMERFPIRPTWSKPEFDWLVSVASLNQSLGSLQYRTVIAEDGSVIGAFLFFGRKGREATVLNVLCAAGHEFDVTGQMFSHLDREGYAQASGIAQPFLMNAISRQRWLSFKHRGYFCMVTRHAEIKDAALRNEIYIGGLASESWSRLLTDF
ncbi:GNAT family N-acetyltransferase [Bosea sp. LC85]|uniref:GNAT family N-acetyltransferase n=1 Tax=Bosea sp. LC85 TaxID=1502851 RepID=UPI001FCBF9C9|nr:GNAT family N-acetyltransferase [Bosea sp. LC85]